MDNTTVIMHTTPTPPPVVELRVVALIILVFQGILSNIIAICGLFTNVIVMKVFYRQGIMSESSSVSLFALTLCDFLALVSSIAFATSNTVQMGWEMGIIAQPYINPNMIVYFSFRPKMVLGQIICWITAYLSFERCFSVIFPFSVRQVFSPKRSIIAIVCIFAGSLITLFPLYINYDIIKMIWNNKTLITFYWYPFISMDFIFDMVLLNPIIIRNTGICIVLLSNVLILIRIKSSKNWRKTATASTNKEQSKKAFRKETKLIKMVSLISIIFVACTTPTMLNNALSQLEFKIFDRSFERTLAAIVTFCESINSTVNIFVFYNMSSNFNEEFRRMFRMDKKKK